MLFIDMVVARYNIDMFMEYDLIYEATGKHKF